MHPLHHLHQRKRAVKTAHPYPAKDWRVKVLDRIVFAAGIVGPVMTLPQLQTIYIAHQAAGVSVLSWGAFALLDVPWIVYGIVHRDRTITMTYVLWLIINTAVAVGAIMYGGV